MNLGAPITGVSFASTGFSAEPIVTFTADSVSVNIQGEGLSATSGFTIMPLITTATLFPSGPFSFTQVLGGPAPAQQNLQITSIPVSSTFSAQVSPVTGGNWLKINSGFSAAGTIIAPQNLALTIDPAVASMLAPGQYSSQIKLSFPGLASPNKTVMVSLAVVGRALGVSIPSLAFTYDPAVAPGSQSFNVTSVGGPLNFSVAASSGGNWLIVDTSIASTPQTVHISIDTSKLPASFPAGAQLIGTVTINSPLAQPSSIAIPVTLTSAAPSAPQPSIIENGASLSFGPIAAGEVITILGTHLGPPSPASFVVNSRGGVDPSLAGVQVMFDSFPGTSTYVSNSQINVVVPYEIAGQATTNLYVTYAGQRSATFPLAVMPIAPAIFTFNSTGRGQAIAQNVTGPTSGTNNGPSSGVAIGGFTLPTSPVPKGDFISVYVTGGGVTIPPGQTGSVNSSTTLMPLLNWTPASGTVTATIGGTPAAVVFAGAAPGLISGIYQVDVQVPLGISGDALPLVIRVNGIPSPAGPTIAVQ